MQRFIDDNSTYSFQFPVKFGEELSPLCMTEARLTGSVSDTLADFSSCCTLPPRSKYSTLDDQDMEYIKLLFSNLNPFFSGGYSQLCVPQVLAYHKEWPNNRLLWFSTEICCSLCSYGRVGQKSVRFSAYSSSRPFSSRIEV